MIPSTPEHTPYSYEEIFGKPKPKPRPKPKKREWRERKVEPPEVEPRIVELPAELPEKPKYRVYYGGYQQTFQSLEKAQTKARQLYSQAQRMEKAGYEPVSEARRMQAWIERRGGVSPEMIERRYGLILGLPSEYRVTKVAYEEGLFKFTAAPRAPVPTWVEPMRAEFVWNLEALHRGLEELGKVDFVGWAGEFLRGLGQPLLIPPEAKPSVQLVPSAAFIGLSPEEAKYRAARLAEKRGEIPKDSIILDIKATKEGYAFTYMPTEEWRKLPAYVKEKREPTFWEIPLYKHYMKTVEGAISWKRQVQEMFFGEKMVAIRREPLGRVEEEKAFVPVGVVKVGEATVGFAEALAGRPSVRSYIPTVSGAITPTLLSPLPKTQIGPFQVGEGGFTLEHLKREWESVEKHPGMLVGELYAEALTGLAMGWLGEKAWKSIKAVGGKAKWTLPKAVQKRLWPVEYGRREIEKQLAWGEAKFLQPGGFEVWASAAEAHRYVGYPIVYGRKGMYVVIQVTKPTAFQQIMRGIERGMFPRMGGLSARQQLVLGRGVTGTGYARLQQAFRNVVRGVAKPTKAVAITLPKVSLEKLRPSPVAVSYEVQRERFRQVTLQKPKQVERLVAPPKLALRQAAYELEKEKYRALEVEVQKPRQKVALVPKLQLRQRLTLAPPRLVAPPTIYRPPYQPPSIPAYRERRLKAFVRKKRREALFGRWFKRRHPIAEPRQVLSLVSGKRKKRAGKGSFGARVRALVSG